MRKMLKYRASLISILEELARNTQLPEAKLTELHSEMLQDSVFRSYEKIQSRSLLYKKTYPKIKGWADQSKLQINIPERLWGLWLPLVEEAIALHSRKGPIIQGISGGPGLGKTTMSTALCMILEELGYKSASISSDDFYKTYEERQKLKQTDPDLLLRGPPGTHDICLYSSVLKHLKDRNNLSIPVFDKSIYNGQGDRTGFRNISAVDFLIIEGSFVGFQPIDRARFENSPYPIVSEEDKQLALRMNSRLENYTELWNYLDSLLILRPVSFELSVKWRWEAELSSIQSGKQGLSQEEILGLITFFWKSVHPELFIESLVKNKEVDLLVNIEEDHSPSWIERIRPTNK